MKMNMKEKLQSFGKAMLVPIALVAIGGLLLGLGGALTSETTVSSLGINWESYSTSFGFTFFSILKGLGDAIFKNLAILYAVGVAFSLARKEKGMAAFSAMISFFAMQSTINTALTVAGLNAGNTSRDAFIEAGMTAGEAAKAAALYTTNLGYFTYNSGVFGGIALGLLVAYLHNRFYNTKLPVALSFFAGSRTVPIVSLLGGGALGLVFLNLWPFIGGLFSGAADMISNSGLFGTFAFGIIKESLVPFGMHQLVLTPMRWTELGGTMLVDGVTVAGQSAIHLAQLASDSADKLMVRSFMGGSAVVNFAIFPGIALAMYRTAKPENKKKVAGLLIPSIIATTCFGITEPITFTFLFIAPWLYFLAFVPMSAIAEVVCEIAEVSIFQGNIKDWIPFALRPEKLHVTPFLWIMPLFFVASYFIFKTLIEMKNVETPGRESDLDTDEIKLYTKADYNEKVDSKKKKKSQKREDDLELSRNIIDALGGAENIIEVDNCISRLRVLLKDGSLVLEDKVWKNELKAMGVVRLGNAVQIIYGAHVSGIAVDVKETLGV